MNGPYLIQSIKSLKTLKLFITVIIRFLIIHLFTFLRDFLYTQIIYYHIEIYN